VWVPSKKKPASCKRSKTQWMSNALPLAQPSKLHDLMHSSQG
jgi:hypothetical protein